MSVPVSSPTSSPWSSIVLVESTFPSGASFAGSGVMVSPNDVLTASHVLYMPDQGGAATSVQVLPAGISAPFGDITSNSFHYYTNFDPSGSGMLMPGNGGPGLAGSELDLALVDLPTAIGNQAGWMQLDPNFTGGTVNITGLPAASGWMESNDVVDASKSPTDSIISYSAALNPGDSGAPIWYEASGGAHVAGVVSTTSWGGSVDGVYNDLVNWINSDAASIGATASQPAPAATTTTTPTTTTAIDTTASATTTTPTNTAASSGDHVAANLSDFDANGNSDIVWQNTGGAVSIWLMNGGNIAGGWGTITETVPAGTTLAGVGDFNHDGHSDLLWRDASGALRAELMGADGLHPIGSGTVASIGSDWVVS